MSTPRSASPEVVSPNVAPPKVKFPLRAKLAVMAGVIASVPLLALGAFVVDQNKTTLELSVHRLQRSAAHDISRTLANGYREAEDVLDTVGRTLTNTSLPADSRIALALSLVAGSTHVVEVAVYDGEGTLIDRIREQSAQDPLRAPEVLPATLYAVARQRGLATTEIARDAMGPHSVLVVPLSDQERNVTGYVASPIRLDVLNERVAALAEDLFDGDADALFVVDAKKRYVAHTQHGASAEWVSADDQRVLSNLTPGALEKPLLQNGAFENRNGRRFISTFMTDPDRGLAIVAQVDEDIAFASIARLRKVVAAAVALALLLAIFAASFFARRLTRPLERLSRMTTKIAQRRFRERVSVETNDEIAVLATAMNRAAAELEATDAVIKKEAAIRGDLGRYLPQELVERVVKREQDMNLGGTRAQVSILFADVVGFTPLSEKLSPEEVVALLNELFTFMTEIVFKHGGTVDKFIGDCVMAMFGAPTPHEDHAFRAVSAAEDMLRWLEIGNAKWEKQHGVRVQLAIGVHTGDAIIGNIGSQTRMEYTAIGETVNIAARLESVARPQQVLVSGATREMLDGAFDLITLGAQDLAGVSKSIDVFALESI